MIRTALTLTTALTLAAGAAAAQSGAPVDQGPANFAAASPAFDSQTRVPAADSGVTLETASIAGGLEHPWAVAVLPGDAGYLVTERTGRLLHIARDGAVSPITGAPEVFARRQGGLLDVKLGPDFAETRRIYLTYAKPLGDGRSATAAAYATLSEDLATLTGLTEIFVQDPPSSSPMHYGSRIVFDGNGHVFITTGEHSSRSERVYAQDLDKTYGKIVRLTLDGAVPDDNPFADRDGAVASIWSLGHRNVQGAAIRPSTGELWAIEHGPRGGDELNLIAPGANYGWPVVSYGINYGGSRIGSGQWDHAANGFTEPRYYWDPVIAPGDMVFYDGEMFPDWQGDVLIGGLVSGGLVRIALDGDTATGEERLVADLGRTRDVAIDHDGALLAVTDYESGELVRIAPADATN